jgi:hypothetical protein
MFCSFFVIIVVLCIFIFVCTSVGLLPPGESPIEVSNNNNSNNNNNNNNNNNIFNKICTHKFTRPVFVGLLGKENILFEVGLQIVYIYYTTFLEQWTLPE